MGFFGAFWYFFLYLWVLHGDIWYFYVIFGTISITGYYKLLQGTTSYYKLLVVTTVYRRLLHGLLGVRCCVLMMSCFLKVLICDFWYFCVIFGTFNYYRLLQVTTGYYKLLQVNTSYYCLQHVTRGVTWS